MNTILKFLIVVVFINCPYSHGQCFIENGNLQNTPQIYSSSGNNWIDQTYHQQNQYLSSVTKLKVQYGFYDDSAGLNAFAMDSYNYNLDGETYFGLNLLNKYIIDNGQEAYNNILWILSHEYGHIIQFKYGRLWQDVKRNELQADFLAGAMTLKLIIDVLKNKYGSTDNIEDEYLDLVKMYIDNAKAFFSSIGDTDFGNPQHHGTHKERMAAYYAGLSSEFLTDETFQKSDGTLNLSYIFVVSKNYVNGLENNNIKKQTKTNSSKNNLSLDETVDYLNTNIKRIYPNTQISIFKSGKIVEGNENGKRYSRLKIQDVIINFDNESGSIDFECKGNVKCFKNYHDVRNDSRNISLIRIDDSGNTYETDYIDEFSKFSNVALYNPNSFEKAKRLYKALIHFQNLVNNLDSDPFRD